MNDPLEDYSPAMTHWFGSPWPYPHLPAPVCADERFRIDIPSGEDCFECKQPITGADSGIRMPFSDGTTARWIYLHAECQLRNVMCPRCMGLLPGPHTDDPIQRREEGLLLMRWARAEAR